MWFILVTQMKIWLIQCDFIQTRSYCRWSGHMESRQKYSLFTPISINTLYFKLYFSPYFELCILKVKVRAGLILKNTILIPNWCLRSVLETYIQLVLNKASKIRKKLLTYTFNSKYYKIVCRYLFLSKHIYKYA